MAETQSDEKPVVVVGSEEVEQRELLIEKLTEGEESKKEGVPPECHWTTALVFAVLAAAFGSSFQYGYHIGNINLPADLIKDWFNQSHHHMHGTSKANIDHIWAWAVSIFAVGGMIGGVSVGFVADKLGRKTALLYNNALAVIAAALMAGSKYVGIYWLFILGRLIIGLNSGLNSGLAPMYLTEISPTNLRGAIGSFAQLFVTIAILFSQVLGLPFLLGTPDRWPYIFGFTFVPVVVQLCALPFCPESPKFNLVVRGRKEQAEKDLQNLRQQDDVSTELDLINEEAIAAQSQAKVKMTDMFGEQLLWPLTLAMFMMVSQKFSGTVAVHNYASIIMTQIGIEAEHPTYTTLGMAAINVLMTIVSVYLVDHPSPSFGRRTLHISGMVGMCFSTAMIAISMIVAKSITWFYYISILFVFLFVISFATGPNSIPWFYVNEVFPSNARGSANSFAVLTNWLCTFFVNLLFPLIDKVLHEYIFFMFTFFLAVFIMFALKFLPETKNKTLEEVQEEMDRRRGRSSARSSRKTLDKGELKEKEEDKTQNETEEEKRVFVDSFEYSTEE